MSEAALSLDPVYSATGAYPLAPPHTLLSGGNAPPIRLSLSPALKYIVLEIKQILAATLGFSDIAETPKEIQCLSALAIDSEKLLRRCQCHMYCTLVCDAHVLYIIVRCILYIIIRCIL
jgi:hypothetical protein